eukprot:TRINITY_DN17891_c0_g1_i1.p1 TRINITY_DN17891_c0_g1~~TRINITY_DN17891_c0_g1_i1.p1  ORF type:complete len:314 (+),score=40.93 TRINITY_DN17891_c0_g1_i1:73-1014(+)
MSATTTSMLHTGQVESKRASSRGRPHPTSNRIPSEDKTGRIGRATAAAGRALVEKGSRQGSRPPSLGRAPSSREPAARQTGDVVLKSPGDSLEDLLSNGLRSRSNPVVSSRIPRPGGKGQGRGDNLDFDDEARKLWARLNLDPSNVRDGPYNALDALWRHPQSGAIFYVGNQTAAADASILQQHKIAHVVNCTNNMPFYHQKSGHINYFRFDISSHYHRVKSDADAVAFVQPVLDWISAALAEGRNVIVHCLAGAHRAGTTGCLCLMHFAGLPRNEAIAAAKKCRSIIDPIGAFPELLARVERGWKVEGRRSW